MKVAFIVISVADRINELNTLVATIRALPQYDDIDLCLLFQGAQEVADRITNRDRYAHISVVPGRTGCVR